MHVKIVTRMLAISGPVHLFILRPPSNIQAISTNTVDTTICYSYVLLFRLHGCSRCL